MWRLYAELFVLVVVAFALGAALAALVLRIVVKERTGTADAASADTTGTPGGPS